MTQTFQQTLIAALTATSGPDSQIAGIEFDADKYVLIGEVPIAVQHLHNIDGQMNHDARALHHRYQQTVDGSPEEAELEAQLKAIKKKLELIGEVKWQLMYDAFPQLHSGDYGGCAILENWQAAATLKSEKDMMDGGLEAALMAALSGRGDGDGADILAAMMGGRRR